MGEHSALPEHELTDDEIVAIWESTTAGVRAGTIPIFDGKDEFITDALRRFIR